MKPFTFSVTGKLLEYKEGEFQGNAYSNCKIRSAQIADNSILKYKIDRKQVASMEELLDQEITVDVAIERGPNDTAILKVVRLHADGFANG